MQNELNDIYAKLNLQKTVCISSNFRQIILNCVEEKCTNEVEETYTFISRPRGIIY